METKKILTCEGCDAKCCKHVAMEIDTPEDLRDFENIKWYVAHKNIQVYVDCDNVWNIEFLTPCKYLDENNKCSIYDKRPLICREYSPETCVFHNDYKEKYVFKSIEDVEKYIQDIFKKGLHKTDEN